ncbi:NAD-glutamate dehydrogenase [Solicola sp. PLA-1-18]|uniref:NAD-glutamate dehydrogenase n=1 Tax=Solicola sp. PLA-1-18 TaxID=3380532 RepID=UPI003B7F4EB0
MTIQDRTGLVAYYYRDLPASELAAESPDELEAAALSHRSLASACPQGSSLVRAFTPSVEDDGWNAGGHIVVEVVTADRPFLVDSVTSFLVEHGYGIDRIVHPQLLVTRDADGTLVDVRVPDPSEPARAERDGLTDVRESWIHVDLDSSSDPEVYATIEQGLRDVLRDVEEVTQDWRPMTARALELADALHEPTPGVPADEVDEARELLAWLADGHFTFMGYRDYAIDDSGGAGVMRVVPDTGLGLLRSDRIVSSEAGSEAAAAAARTSDRSLLIVTKADTRSTVHRPVYLDRIGIRTYDESGTVVGEHRFLGLFTSSAYAESVLRVPVLGRRTRAVLEHLRWDPASYNGKALVDLLEGYPRDELFSARVPELAEIATDLLNSRDRRQVRSFVRRDELGRFLSCLVYLPRDRYTTTVRLRMQALLADVAGEDASVEYTALVSDQLLARLHFVVRPAGGGTVADPDHDLLQARLVDAARTWDDDFSTAIDDVFGQAATTEALQTYAGAFPEAYKEDFTASVAVRDLQWLESLAAGTIALKFRRSSTDDQASGRIKIYRHGQALSLADVLPVFTSLGVDVVDERPYRISVGSEEAWVYDFGLHYEGRVTDAVLGEFQNAFVACWGGAAEADGFNRLVLGAGLTWRQVVVLRTYAKYLRQAGSPFSQDYQERALLDNGDIARLVVQLFETRFDPDGGTREERTERSTAIEKSITAALDEVASLDADRILRSFVGLVRATLRTNFYQQDEDGRPKSYVSVKLDARSIDDLPEPRPRFEIFCYSPRVEGVHLRFGPVARGGLRWSDRREDFRTEILGLVKAQMVKNTVIVPVGSKGGFYCKRLPDPAVDREAWLAEGVACYRTFISSLLDITDDRRGTQTVPPERVVRWDGDDSYLVVAADKGTATFSDIANGVSADYGFWLGDAFASGGSIGYDHKAMGITARGAWESVKRHFREMGVDCQNQDFTCVGVGDMSGDVFGNGMLLSRHTRLVAAFDHRHVFLDPNPDAATSFAERERMFALPRSSWADYDTSLISEGGGVYPRTAKSIPVSPQVREALGLTPGVTRLSPAELLTAVLKAPVDLLWNGGIGTYVKASTETHEQVGDKANNAIRVNGADLRVRCVGEGGNLGLTQLGRIEYAASGGRIDTDFIDNSAGVDTSDHEVNIKILLDRVVESGELDVEGRNELLPTMTDEVAGLVLAHNYDQNIALANSQANSSSLVHAHEDWIRALEREGHLDREIEFLPEDEVIDQRRAEGKGLTTPELAVLLAYTKIVLADELLASGIADDPFFRGELYSYFPSAIQHRYRAAIDEHPLRREIVVTRIVNQLVDSAGITFYHRLRSETGASIDELARAHAVAREIYGTQALSDDVDALDNQVAADVQTQVRLALRTLDERVTRWLVNNQRDVDAEQIVDYFGTTVQRVVAAMPRVLVGRQREAFDASVAGYVEAGLPDDIAHRAASVGPAYSAMGIAHLAHDRGLDPELVAAVHVRVGEALGLDLFSARVQQLPRDDRWRTMARASLRDELHAVHVSFAEQVLEQTDGDDAQARVDAWVESHRVAMDRAADTLDAIWAEDEIDLARLSVALRVVRGLL